MHHPSMPRRARAEVPLTVTAVRATSWPTRRRLVALGRLTRSGGQLTVVLSLVPSTRPTRGAR